MSVKSLTHDEIVVTTTTHVDGHVFAVPRIDRNGAPAFYVGKVDERYANLLSHGTAMYSALCASMEANEQILRLLESEGLDRVASDLQRVIGNMKIVQKVILEGPEALTGLSHNAT